MNNFISIVNQFNLVIYTDDNTVKYINTNDNPRIKIIIKPITDFYNYKYKDYWIKNHEKNILLNDKSCWQLNMLWCEKISFVKETVEKKYFVTDFYGWCDIGYFRNRIDDTHTAKLMNWSNQKKILELPRDKIVYACINNNDIYLSQLMKIIQNKNVYGLPVNPIPPNQTSIAGGFFILYKNMIDLWLKIFDNKLESYFKNNYLVKDDQMIIVDCIFSNQDIFTLFRESNYPYDNWFMFQRILN
jgi:hypothetical protein